MGGSIADGSAGREPHRGLIFSSGWNEWRGKAFLLLIILAGVFAIGRSPLRPKPFSDGYFHEEAKGLRAVLLSGDLRKGVPIIHSPGVPFYYLTAYLAVPRGSEERLYWYAGVGWNCLMLWMGALMLGATAQRLGGGMAGWIAAAGVPITFFPLYYSAGIATETAAFVGAAAVVWAGVRLAAGSRRGWMRGGLLLGLALAWLVVMRGNYVLAIPLALLAGLLGKKRELAAGACLACAVAVVLCLGVYLGVARLNRAMGAMPRQDSFLTHVLIQGAFQYRSEPFDWRPWERETREGSADYAAYAEIRRQLERRQEESGLPLATVEWEWLRRSAVEEPWAWVRMAPFKVASALWFRISPVRIERVFGRGDRARVVALLISAVLNAPFLLALGLALWGTWRGRKEQVAGRWICWTPFLAGALFIAGTYSEPRYLVPGFGGVLVLAAVEVGRCGGLESVAQRWWPRLFRWRQLERAQ